MLHTLLHSRPQIRQKTLVLGQAVMLAHAPENCCALIFLFSPVRPWGFFDVVSLGPATVRLLNFFTPLIEGGRVLIVSATVESGGNEAAISRPGLGHQDSISDRN